MSLAGMFIALGACGGKAAPEGTLSRAEAFIAAEDFAGARICADSITSGGEAVLRTLSPVTLCRLAVVYKKLSDVPSSGSEDADLAMAMHCYREAFGRSADSVIAFRRSLKLDDAAAFEVLSMLEVVSDKSQEEDSVYLAEPAEAVEEMNLSEDAAIIY